MRDYTSRNALMQRRSIVLFARAPEREAAAKRMPSAAPLFRAVIAAWLEAARRHDALPLIACAEEDRAALASIAPSIAREWIAQSAAPFGTRVADAASDAFARGCASVIIAAIDAPPPHDVARAFAALESGSAVIGPARDGGINFIGLTSPDRALLEKLTPRRRDLVTLCRAHFDTLLVLHAVTDVDSAAALRFARNEKAWRFFFGGRKPALDAGATLASVPRLQLPSRAPPVPLPAARGEG